MTNAFPTRGSCEASRRLAAGWPRNAVAKGRCGSRSAMRETGRRRVAGVPCLTAGSYQPVRGFLLTEAPNPAKGAGIYGGGAQRAALFVFHTTAGADPLRRIGSPPGGCASFSRNRAMAKPTTVKTKLVSTADTGFFYVRTEDHPSVLPSPLRL